MNESFRTPESYNTLLYAMAKGYNRIGEIAKFSGFPKNKCDKYIKALIEHGLVIKVPGENGHTKYLPANTYLTLWYKCLLTAVPNPNGSFGEDVFNRFMQVFNDELMADFYKDMCNYWLEKNLNSISTEYIDTKNSSYHNVKVGNVTFDLACEKKQAVYAYYDITSGGKLTQKLWEEIENSTTKKRPFYENEYVNEIDIQNKILEVTQGMPLYLDVCVDTYRSAKSSGETVTQDLFDNRIEKLAKRLMTYMSDEEKDVLYLLSCLGRWKTEEYFAINDKLNRNSVNNSIYNKVLTLTFVRNESDSYFIHQTMQEILIQYCDEEKIENYVMAMFAYIESEETISTTFFKYLYLISKICGIRKNSKLSSWWIPKASEALDIYLDGFCLNQFISIYELLTPVTDDYKLKTLYLNYLLKKGDYNKALNYINDTKADDVNNIDVLKFLLTASYYYYINGIDDIAFKLRKKVYEKRIELLGDTDRETIRAGLALSASYSRMGKHEESINLGNECRAKLEDSSETYDSMISAARNQLGDSYFRLGNMEDAMKIYCEVYKNRKKWLGEKNNSTMIAYNHIADCLVNLGKYEDALKIYKAVRETRKQEFSRDEMYEYVVNGITKKSNDHPDTIIVDNNMAVCLINIGKYEEAFN